MAGERGILSTMKGSSATNLDEELVFSGNLTPPFPIQP